MKETVLVLTEAVHVLCLRPPDTAVRPWSSSNVRAALLEVIHDCAYGGLEEKIKSIIHRRFGSW